MSEKAPIVVCVPFMKPQERHLEHFEEWYAANRVKHNLVRVRIFWRALHQAQGRAVQMAREIGASHILFTEDDQWGMPVDGLDVLLEADKDVIGFRSYFKKYPFLSMAFRKKDPSLDMVERHPNFQQIEGVGSGDPIQKVDLISWAFTLVKMSVFDRMREAWGRVTVKQDFLKAVLDGDPIAIAQAQALTADACGLDPFECWGKVPTDSYFSQYCEDIGIERWCHFGYIIGNGDVPPKQIPQYRRLHDSLNVMRRQAGKMRVAMQDDYGITYGEGEYIPESAREILRREGHTEELEGTPCVS